MTLLSVKSIQGKREYMEDRYIYYEKLGIKIAMICDGHGGKQASNETVRNLPQLLWNGIYNLSGQSNLQTSIKIREIIMKWGNYASKFKSGSTLTGILVKGNTVFVYNIGDSRTCVFLQPNSFVYKLQNSFDAQGQYIESSSIYEASKSFFCTYDHDPQSAQEILRVTASGGSIVDERLNGVLSVTRALGDNNVGKGLSYVPDVYWIHKPKIIGNVLLMSDGIYEMQRYKSPANFDNKYLYNLANRFTSSYLVDYAYKNGSTDNLTALVVKV